MYQTVYIRKYVSNSMHQEEWKFNGSSVTGREHGKNYKKPVYHMK